MFLQSEEINGEILNELGILYKLTEKDNLSHELENLINLLNEQSFVSICMIKDQIRKGLDLNFKDTLEVEQLNQNSRFVHSDAAEGMASFIEKRKPAYKNRLDDEI